MRHQTLSVAIAVFAIPFLAGAQDPEPGGHRDRVFRATLVGSNEIPDVLTPGFGRTRLVIDDDKRTIDFHVTYNNLQAPISVAHVHFAPEEENGGVMFFFCGGGGQDPCPANSMSGTLTGTVTVANIVGPAAQGITLPGTPPPPATPEDFDKVVRVIRSGRAYSNVHSTRSPSGEIRGQLK
jgi:hypothetical protein